MKVIIARHSSSEGLRASVMSSTAIFFLVFIVPTVDLKIYVYNSRDSPSVELYDCITHLSMPYCRRPNGPIRLARRDGPRECHHNGTLHTFSALRAKNVAPSTILHGWKSATEKVEEYNFYSAHGIDNKDYLCQCTNMQSFGKNCEYLLPAGRTFAEAAQSAKDLQKANATLVQVHGDIICYVTLECNSGLLCLDWRDLCDGIQQCMEGLDEENCDILEANECDEDEYRCMNGLCIPDEYFLDGEFDCLDWSDEMPYYDDRQCADEAASAQCDDRYCPPQQWSCGDGQCVRDRFLFQKLRQVEFECRSQRDQYFLCETHYAVGKWTLASGRCMEGSGYYEPDQSNYTVDEECQYLLRCALSYGLDHRCLCRNPFACPERSNDTCPLNLIRYPRAEIIAPYMLLLYNRSRNFTRYDADLSLISGTIKCGRTLVDVSNIQWPFNPHLREVEESLCRSFSNASSNSSDVLRSSRECAEIGTKMQRYRFRCSMNETTCLSVTALGDLNKDCPNGNDESWMGNGGKLIEIRCNREMKSGCSTLQSYIKSSWTFDGDDRASEQLRIPFRSYCDTFWNLQSREDESRDECRTLWTCAKEQWRCHSGQCIDPAWVLDGEWDCLDASDEDHRIFPSITDRNNGLVTFSLFRNQSFSLQQRSSFNTMCNLMTEFPCLRVNDSHSATALTHDHLCISRDRLGDGHIDCYGAIDEQNTASHCDRSTMLGYHFKCLSSDQCIPYVNYCDDKRCRHSADDIFWCRDLQNVTTSQNSKSAFCLNGTWLSDGRCDGKRDCPMGEDEYLCDHRHASEQIYATYRKGKQLLVGKSEKKLRLRHIPSDATVTELKHLPAKSSASIVHSNLTEEAIDYSCNRGVGAQFFDGSLVCFCPPSYYGDRCEYHSDRLTVVFHIDFSQSIYTAASQRLSSLKFVILLLFDNETIGVEIMIVQPSKEIALPTKKTVYLPYSRSARFLAHKRSRYRNRSSLLHDHPYSLRIEAYEGQGLAKLHLIAVWQYPISFDYLPVYRLTKVLRLTSTHRTPAVCSANPCPPNADCLTLQNNQSQYVCLCKANFTGENCSSEDKRCTNNHCAVGSACRPNYSSHLIGRDAPLCICSFDRSGERCGLLLDQCSINPCQHNGTCTAFSRSNTTRCLCTERHYGDRCELDRPEMLFYANETTNLSYAAVVLQFFTIDLTALNLILVHQEVHRQRLPPTIENRNGSIQAPEIVLAKLYPLSFAAEVEVHVISIHVNMISVTSTIQLTEKNRCPTVLSLSLMNNTTGLPGNYSPIAYHQLCQSNADRLCFRDQSYLCLCSDNNTRAACFGYDSKLDRCFHCSSGGHCIQAKDDRTHDFLCLCPPCYAGERCQFNMNSFGFTLDQLFLMDLRSVRRPTTVRLVILVPLLMFLLALPNNLFSLLTFRRQFLLGNSIAQYLLVMSVINQLNLGFLAARLIHLTAHIIGFHSHPTRDAFFCKTFSYLLATSNRMVYWLSALVAIERMYMTLVVNGRWLSQAHVARRLTVLTLGSVLLSKVHELFFVKTLSHIGGSAGGICILEFPVSHRSKWLKFHLSQSVINSLMPLLINICSTITIICVVTKKKMNTRRLRSRKFDERIRWRRAICFLVLDRRKVIRKREEVLTNATGMDVRKSLKTSDTGSFSVQINRHRSPCAAIFVF